MGSLAKNPGQSFDVDRPSDPLAYHGCQRDHPSRRWLTPVRVARTGAQAERPATVALTMSRNG
jgi:hypothetical protein